MKSTPLLFFGVMSIPLTAGTVSLAGSASLPTESPTSCAQSGPGPVSCFLNTIFSDPTGRNTAFLGGSASADFGLINGSVSVSNDNANFVQGSYQSSFSDFVTVLGAAGSGTLVTHYHLVSTEDQFILPGLAVRPDYHFFQDGTSVNYTPNLPIDTPTLFTLAEDFDVTAPVLFGVPIAIGADTQATMGIQFRNGTLATSSSAQITGYTVLDSSGHILADAIVQRGAVPEPSTLWTGAIILVLIAGRARRAVREH